MIQIPNYIEFAPQFLAVEDLPERFLVEELLPEGITALFHGEPRLKKSWACLEIAIACATGKPAFGLERFAVPQAVPVLYSSQEDGDRRVRERVKRLLSGKGIGCFPDRLAFSVHKGISLDNLDWQDTLLRNVAKHGFKLVIFDPIRRYTQYADKGPAEVNVVTSFLRQLSVECGTSVLINHHDIKPPTFYKDNRRSGHRASGGDWFAASDCPVGFTARGGGSVLVTPEDYKFSEDPEPFTFGIEEDEGKTWARLVGNNVGLDDIQDGAVENFGARVVDFLKRNPKSSGNEVAAQCHMNRDMTREVLGFLKMQGKADFEKGPRNSQLWFLIDP